MGIIELDKYSLFKEEELKSSFGDFDDVIATLVSIQIEKNTNETSKLICDWLRWCKKQNDRIKVIEHKISPGILPKHIEGAMYDVKVQGKKWAPDDKLYNNHKDLRYDYAFYDCCILFKVAKKFNTQVVFLFNPDFIEKIIHSNNIVK